MSVWRVIYTDSESASGVAPVCEHKDDPAWHTPNEWGGAPDPGAVFDCCPHPQIETWGEDRAAALAALLTEVEAEVCS